MKLAKIMPVVLAGSMLLTACSSGGADVANTDKESSATKTEAPAETTEGGETLNIWTYLSDNEQKVFQSFVDRFAEEKNITINAEFIPFGDYKKQVSVALAGDSLPDIIMIDNPDHAAFASMGVFEDVTDKMNAWENKDKYFEGPLKSTMYDDKYYGIPFTSNCLALFYNKTMMEAAGVQVPTTWDELQSAAAAMTTEEVFGLGVASPKGEEATFQFLPWMISAGGSYDKVNSPEVIKAATLWLDMIKAGSMSKETINWVQGDVQKQFMAEKLGMFVGGPWMIAQIQNEAPNLDWGVTTIPIDQKQASVLGGENLGIVAGSENVDLAWEFLQYMGDYDIMKEFIGQTGFFPPRADVAQEPEWTEDPIKKMFAEQMASAMPRGPHPAWPEISAAIYTALQECLTETKTPEKAFNDAQAVIDPLLQ